MSQSMSPEQFLSLPHDPEDDHDDAPTPPAKLWEEPWERAGDNSAYVIPPGHETVVRHPLAEIATSLAAIADSLQRPLVGPSDDERQLLEALTTEQEHVAMLIDDLTAARALLDGVREICKPSVGKLAIAIRALLDPEPEAQVSEPPADAPAGEPAAEPQDQPPQTGQPEPLSNATDPAHPQPETNAPVEDWRAYARALGYEAQYVGTTWMSLEQMNRSQIRTMLGVPHTPADAEGQPTGGAA